MTNKTFLKLNPVAGYGWRRHEKNESVSVPGPFTIDLTARAFKQSDKCYIGKINEKGHPYENLWVVLSLRSTSVDGNHYNVIIFNQEPNISAAGELVDEAGIEVTGFANLAS